jgi:Sec-independent protein translocase protein TatA
MMPFDLSLEKLALILVVSLLVFGPGKTVEFAREAGKWVRELRRMWADAAREMSLQELWSEEPAATVAAAAPSRACPACGSRNVSEKTECGLCGTALPAAARRANPVAGAEAGEKQSAGV